VSAEKSKVGVPGPPALRLAGFSACYSRGGNRFSSPLFSLLWRDFRRAFQTPRHPAFLNAGREILAITSIHAKPSVSEPETAPVLRVFVREKTRAAAEAVPPVHASKKYSSSHNRWHCKHLSAQSNKSQAVAHGRPLR
jgi:hypothetical protein